MKIGIDARMYGAKQTGIGIYIESLIGNILNLDNKNEYILFLNEIEGAEKLLGKYKNVKLIKVDIPWYSYGEQLFFPFLIWREKIDLMHFPHFNVPIFCPVKFVVTIHDMTPKYFPGNKVGKSFFRRIMFDVVMRSGLNKAEKIIAVSNFTKNEILKFYPHTQEINDVRTLLHRAKKWISGKFKFFNLSVGVYSQIKKEKIVVIYEGIREEFLEKIDNGALEECSPSEPQFVVPATTTVTGSAKNLLYEQNQSFSPAPVSSGLHSSRTKILETTPFIFYTGVWRNHKNLVGLIKVFKILKDKYKIPHKLVLGGSEDPNYPEVRKTWNELKLENDIILTGFLDFENQRNLYRHCDLYVLPSFSEGFSFTPLEAMSQGAAVALSDIPAHRELSGDLPVYFDPFNPEDMAEKMYFALNDKDFRIKFSSQGILQARKYRWEICARETLTRAYEYDIQ